MKRIANVILVLFILGLVGSAKIWALPSEQGTNGAITSPVEGQVLHGVVTIEGSAAGDQFQFYKIEYRLEGAADDVPWVLVGDDVRRTPVVDGVLDNWDTTFVPDGVYILRLRVVDMSHNYQEDAVGGLLVQNTAPPTPAPPPTPGATPTPSLAPGQEMLTPEGLMTQLAGINEIIGAVYDPSNGMVFLVGRVAPDLPPLNLDDLVMAIRIIYNGEFPAVSIDPGPDNSVMDVRYFGNTENTHFGWVMFEADRMLKIYSMGVDNLTRLPIASAVTEYRSELDLSDVQQGWRTVPLWHRMWFEPAGENGPVVITSSDRRVILFDTAQMVVKTEYVSVEGSPKPKGSDPAAEKFVGHFNQHFAEFAAEHPVLHNLAQLQRFVIIARWLKDQGVPADMLWVKDWPVPETETPATTPRISASRNFGAFALVLGGGVDLSSENQYQEDDARARGLYRAVESSPSVQGVRSGPIEVEGQERQIVSLPIWQASYYREKDASGWTWVIDRATGKLLCLIDESGKITNFDDYEGSYLSQKTISLSDDTVSFVIADGRLSSVIYASRETMEADLPLLLVASQGGVVAEVPSAQYAAYDRLARNNRLAPLAWSSLQTVSGEDVSLWPVEAAGEQFLVVLADGAALTVPQGDVVESLQLGERTAQLVTGQSAFHLYNRLRAAALSDERHAFIYLFEQEDGTVALQVGQQTYPLDRIWAELEETLDALPDDQEAEDRALILDQIIALAGPDVELIVFSGQGFADTEAGRKMKARFQEGTGKLALALRRHGILRVSTDDDIEKAKANLDNQQPIVDEQGGWNMEMIIHEGSLANLSDEGREYIEQIRVQARAEGLPVHADWESLTGVGNITFVTAHNSEELQTELRQLDKETLTGKYLVLATCGEQDAETVNHEFIRNTLIDEYGATGVFIPQNRISPRAVQVLFEEVVKLKLEGSTLKAYHLINQAIENALQRDDLNDDDRRDLIRLEENNSIISMMLSPDQQAPLGLG